MQLSFCWQFLQINSRKVEIPQKKQETQVLRQKRQAQMGRYLWWNVLCATLHFRKARTLFRKFSGQWMFQTRGAIFQVALTVIRSQSPASSVSAHAVARKFRLPDIWWHGFLIIRTTRSMCG